MSTAAIQADERPATSMIPAVIAGIIATTISYAGPLVIIVQAAASLEPALVASWIWAISIGSGVLGVWLSLKWRVPVVIAWNSPGSALLVTMLPGVDFGAAIGAYIVANLAVLAVGLSGAFDKVVGKLPIAITSAMLAGVLFRFLVDMVGAVPATPGLVLAMMATFFAFRILSPRYAVVAVLVVGVLFTAVGIGFEGTLQAPHLTLPVWTTPQFDIATIISIGLPLAVVALTGQFLPGIAILRTHGYEQPPARPIITASAIGSILLAPFGCHGVNLAAFTAAICLGPDAHPDRTRRWIAGVSGGITYVIFGCFAGTVLALFALLPTTLVAALAGLALFPTIAGSVAGAVKAETGRDAALITFVVSVSGVSLLGLGSAFWGLIFGLAVHALQRLAARDA